MINEEVVRCIHKNASHTLRENKRAYLWNGITFIANMHNFSFKCCPHDVNEMVMKYAFILKW